MNRLLEHQAAEVRAGRQSPIALVEECLSRIRETEPRLHAFIRVEEEGALAEAAACQREVRAGRVRGPLHGLPVAVKDLFDLAGGPTTAGAAIRRHHRATETATAVRRLQEAGAVVVGKTNLHEFAFGVTSVNPHFGAVGNPANPAHVAGGSSGGSGAAVAVGGCLAALGTDTGGSIRIPAALCGIVGLKPTFGRISRRGVVPLSWSFDTIGPMTQTVADAALLLSVLAGPDRRDPIAGRYGGFAASDLAPPGRYRVGRLTGALFDEEVDADVAAAIESTAVILGKGEGRVQDVKVEAAEAGQAAQTTILFAEAAAYHQRAYPGRLSEYGIDVRELLAAGATIPATAYVEAQRVQSVVIAQVRSLFEKVDVLLCPTVPIPAPRIDQVDPARGEGWRRSRAPLSRCTRLFNLTGLPAVSVPVGRTRDGLPIGAQLAAAPGQEGRLLSIAAALEAAVGWEPAGLPA